MRFTASLCNASQDAGTSNNSMVLQPLSVIKASPVWLSWSLALDRMPSKSLAKSSKLAQCLGGKRAEDFVFTRSNGKPVRDFRKAWRNLCATAGVPGLLFHDMRRTAARNFRRAGVAEGVIMRVGGWRTRSVFERYNIISQTDIHDALQKLEQQQQENAKQESIPAFGHDFGHDCDSAPLGSKIERVN